MGIVGAADPDCSGGGYLSAVMLATTGTGDHAAEGGFCGGLRLSVLLCSAVHFQLYQVIGTDINDRLMGIGGMVLGQLTMIDQSALGQMVLPELGLEQKISGVGVVLENPGHSALVQSSSYPYVYERCSLCSDRVREDPNGDGYHGSNQYPSIA